MTSRLLWCLAFVACAQGRPVSAPTIDVPAQPAQIDAGAVPVAREPPPERASPADASLVGKWTGIGTQDDGLSWPIIIDLFTLRPGVCAHVEYPTTPCRADWVCTAARNGELDATEHLLGDSATRCVDNGTMTMRIDIAKDELDWTWQGSGQTATARLHRMP